MVRRDGKHSKRKGLPKRGGGGRGEGGKKKVKIKSEGGEKSRANREVGGISHTKSKQNHTD